MPEKYGVAIIQKVFSKGKTVIFINLDKCCDLFYYAGLRRLVLCAVIVKFCFICLQCVCDSGIVLFTLP